MESLNLEFAPSLFRFSSLKSQELDKTTATTDIDVLLCWNQGYVLTTRLSNRARQL